MRKEKNTLVYRDLKDKAISYGSFLCKDGFILYKVVKKEDANFYLEYTEEDNKFIVTCDSKASKFEIEAYVKSNYEWVLNQWRKIDNPDPWYILGKLTNVKTVIGKEHKVEYTEDLITVYISNKKQYRDTARGFLKEIATKYLFNRVNEILPELGFSKQNINVKWFKHVYGRCWKDRQLDFNANLIQFEPRFIDSVIYHEIAHFSHMNHSKSFHDLLESYNPGHRQIKKEMDNWYFSHHLW